MVCCGRSKSRRPYAPKPLSGRLVNPLISNFNIGALDRCPGDAVCRLLLSGIPGMRGECMIEGFAVDILTMRRKMPSHRRGQVFVAAVWHRQRYDTIVLLKTQPTPRSANCRYVFATEPSISMPRQASSMTMTSNPIILASSAE